MWVLRFGLGFLLLRHRVYSTKLLQLLPLPTLPSIIDLFYPHLHFSTFLTEETSSFSDSKEAGSKPITHERLVILGTFTNTFTTSSEKSSVTIHRS